MHFTRILCFLVCTSVFLSCSTLRPPSPTTSTTTPTPPIQPSKPLQPSPERLFQNRIDHLLSDTIFIPAQVGIKVVSLTRGDILYNLNSKKLFHPASNTKLFSAALALSTLGKDFMFTTRLYTDMFRNPTIIKGNLYIKGSGDPDFTSADICEITQKIKAKGIKRITGDLVGDVSYFDDVEWGTGWMWDDDPSSDGMHISALSVNKNCVTVSVIPNSTTGKAVWVTVMPHTSYVTIQNDGITGLDTSQPTLNITRSVRPELNTIIVSGTIPRSASVSRKKINIWQPELYTLTLLREEMQRSGIAVEGKLRLDSIPPHTIVLTEQSRKLDTVLTEMNRTSDNLSAENILKTVDAEKRKEHGSTAGGLLELNNWLNLEGIDTTRHNIVDGSGLSFYNLVSPETMIRLLEVMYTKKDTGETFLHTLPVAGESGRLQTRMKETPAKGKVFAKTGTLNGVSTLSGYATAANGEMLAFSIMMENFIGHVSPYRNMQDSLAVIFCSFQR